jgi:hypothetical protein
MKKVLIIAAVALTLGGCGTQFGTRLSGIGETISAVQNFSITQGQVDSARNTYDGLVLAPMHKYALLPYCKAGKTLTISNPCHDRKLLKQIRETDKAVEKAFSDTQNSITSGDNSGAVAAYKTLNTAIDLAKTLINQTGISVLGG